MDGFLKRFLNKVFSGNEKITMKTVNCWSMPKQTEIDEIFKWKR